jgi:hypothetical protein
MIGRSQASNLSGMLTSIGDTIGEMGEPGKQYVDTFRRTMAPEIDTESSASMKEYALWARRNGYDDEAVRYENMAIERQKTEQMQQFKQANLKDSSIMRNIHGVDTSNFTDEQKAAVQKAYDLAEQRMNQRGADYEGGKGTEGSDMTNVLLAEDAAQLKLARELQAHAITVQKEQDRLAEQAAAGQIMPADSLPEREYQAYLRQMEAAIGDAGKKQVNANWEKRFDAHRKTVESGAEAQAVLDVAETVAHLAYSDKDKTLGFIDGPVSDWMSENEGLVTAAADATQKALAGNPEYIKASEADRKAIAEKVFKDYLKKISPEFRKSDTEARYDAIAQQGQALYEQQFANRAWKQGLEAGGPVYRKAIEDRFRGKEPTTEELMEFNEEWDRAAMNRAKTSPSSPTNKILNAGPY